MKYGKIIMDDGNEISFEIEDELYSGEVSENSIIQELKYKFYSIIDSIKTTAESTYSGLQKIKSEARPDEFEMSFALKLAGETGIVFAKTATEGSFKVTLRWKKS